jgi:CheY-like chemotaxis protein
MPLMSGRELATALRELRPSIRVLYMSGYPEDFIVDQGVGEPGLVIVDKPFTEPVLLQKLRETLDSETGETQVRMIGGTSA